MKNKTLEKRNEETIQPKGPEESVRPSDPISAVDSNNDNGNGNGASGDKAARKLQIKTGHYVPTPIASSLFERMEDLLNYPKQNRMPCLAVLGDANSGKSRLLQRFYEKHPRHMSPDDYSFKMPVVYFELGDASERGFYDDALDAMKVKVASSHNMQQKERHFRDNCQKLGVRVILIDEFHNGQQGSARQQLQFLTLVRHVSNVLQLPLIVAGLDVAWTFLTSDKQLYTRFEKTSVPLWKDSRDYRSFLKSLEGKLGLKHPSDLGPNGRLAVKLLDMSEGLTGEIVNLLKKAAVAAVDSGEEQITEKLLDSLGWVKPSDRSQ